MCFYSNIKNNFVVDKLSTSDHDETVFLYFMPTHEMSTFLIYTIRKLKDTI